MGGDLLFTLTCTGRWEEENAVVPAVGGYYDKPRASDAPLPFQGGATHPIRVELEG